VYLEPLQQQVVVEVAGIEKIVFSPEQMEVAEVVLQGQQVHMELV
jgi:hypothetical protein